MWIHRQLSVYKILQCIFCFCSQLTVATSAAVTASVSAGAAAAATAGFCHSCFCSCCLFACLNASATDASPNSRCVYSSCFCGCVCACCVHFRVQLFCVLQLHKKEGGNHSFSLSLSLSISLSRCLVHRLTTSRSRLAVCCWRRVARFFIIVLQWRRNKHTHRNYLLEDCRQKRGAGGGSLNVCAYKSIIAVCRWLNTRQELTREGSKRNLNKCKINTNKIWNESKLL